MATSLSVLTASNACVVNRKRQMVPLCKETLPIYCTTDSTNRTRPTQLCRLLRRGLTLSFDDIEPDEHTDSGGNLERQGFVAWEL